MLYQLKSDSKLIKPAVFVLLFLAAFVFFNFSGSASKAAERLYGETVQFRLGGYALGTSAMRDILDRRDAEAEDSRYTAWTEQTGLIVENYALGSRGSFDRALIYFGDNHGIFNIILDNGCALSPKTAFKLFGTSEGILGENVLINGELYVVERLLYDEAAPVVYKASEDNAGVRFDVLDVLTGKGISEIHMNHNIKSDMVIYYREVIWFFSLSFYIPDSFIPTRWSEFEFWADTFAYYSNAAGYYFSMKTYAPDTVFRSYMAKVIIFALLFFAAVIAIAALCAGMIKERGFKIGVNNFKEYFKNVSRFKHGSGEKLQP